VVIGTGKLRTNAIGAIIAIFAIPTIGVVAASNVTVFVCAFRGGHAELYFRNNARIKEWT
jgi:hypothetical protein